MVGGKVVQVVPCDGVCVEVLETTYYDRQWRHLLETTDVRIGDTLWWQSYVGYLSRDGQFSDRDIGRCIATNNPLKAADAAEGA